MHVVVEEPEKLGEIVYITSDENYIIFHPDRLVSAGHVADVHFCLRRTTLQEMIKNGESTKAMVFGTIAHATMQSALVANRWDTDFLVNVIMHITSAYSTLEDLWQVDEDEQSALETIKADYVEQMRRWSSSFIAALPSVSCGKIVVGVDCDVAVNNLLGRHQIEWLFIVETTVKRHQCR